MTRSLPKLFSCRHFAVALAVVLSSTTASIGLGQGGIEKDPVFQTWKDLADVADCGRCHYQAPEGGFSGQADIAISRQNELKFWLEEDKHAIARRRVEPLTRDELVEEAEALVQKLNLSSLPKDWFGASNILSRRMCDKLGYDVTTTEGYNKFRDNCLTCHGGYRDQKDDAHFALDGGAQPGISCNYCHQIGINSEWVGKHPSLRGSKDEWRLMAPEQKAALGMRDLVTVKNQASLCLDCHIGNRSENKFVSHAMYAAGHPPIPSIELHTFCDQMPAHWRTPAKLHEDMASYDGRDNYFKVNYGQVVAEVAPEDTFWNTRKLVIGALAARQKTAQLFVDSAHPDQWADYSLYDCVACHHELKSTSRRQLRGFPGAPGRPRQAEWPNVLFNRLAGSGDLFRPLEETFTSELLSEPFGIRENVVPAAAQLNQQLQLTINRVETTPVHAATATRVLQRLAETPESQMLTYDSARQVVWAMQTVASELKAAGAIDPQVAAMVDALGNPGNTGIESKLPAGRQQFIYANALAQDLDRRAEFNPERLKSQMNMVRQGLARKKSSRLSIARSH